MQDCGCIHFRIRLILRNLFPLVNDGVSPMPESYYVALGQISRECARGKPFDKIPEGIVVRRFLAAVMKYLAHRGFEFTPRDHGGHCRRDMDVRLG